MPRLMPGTIDENIPLMDNNTRDIRSNFEDSENGPDNRRNIRGTNIGENVAGAIHHSEETGASSTHPIENTADVGRNNDLIHNTNNGRYPTNANHENSNVNMDGNVRHSGLQSDNRINTDDPNRHSDNNRNNRTVSLIDEHNRTNAEALNTDTAVNNNISNINESYRNEQLRTNNDINNEVISDISCNNNNQNNDDNSEHQNRDVSRTNNQTRKLNCKNCSRQTIVLIALFVLFCLNLMAIFLVKFVPLNTDGEWTTWGRWSPCTTSCGGGMQFRSRSCINPPPSGKGRLCAEDAMDFTRCNNSCPYKFAAFSAGDPIAIKDGKLTFKTLIYQHGEDFDQDTGIFTCSIPGTYTFSVYLVKSQPNTTLSCHLYKNGDQIMNLILEPNGGQGSSSVLSTVSSTVATYLNMGDIVYLGGCSEPKDTIHWYSIFTGVLESHLN